MLDIYKFSEIEMLGFILVFLRTLAFFVSWPIFSSENVPVPVKVLSALVVSFVLFPLVGWNKLSIGIDSNYIILLAMKEVILGLSIGFLCRLFFFALAIAGQIIAVSMGLTSGQLFNPSLNMEGSSVEQFKVMLGSLFFLFINGHHFFISGLLRTFELVPITKLTLDFSAMNQMSIVVTQVTVIGIKMAAPVMVSVLFMNLAMGIIGRAVPQINVLVTSMPVNILVGFATLALALPLFVHEIQDLLSLMTTKVFEIVRTF